MITLNQSPEIVVELTYLAASNKKSVIHVLHVDDDSSLQEITKVMLQDLDGSFEIDCACCVDEGLRKLAVGNYDVVVSDYEMPQKDGLQFLKELRKHNNYIPFILFTGKGREEVAVKALNLGADGYYNKQGSPETVYGELAHGILLAAQRAKAKSAMEESELKYRTIADSTSDWVYWVSPSGGFVYISPSCEKVTGYTPEEFMKDPQLLQRIISAKDAALVSSHFDLIDSKKEEAFEFRIKSKSGETRWILHKCNPVFDCEGKWLGRRVANIDITELKKTEEKTRNVLAASPDAITITDLYGWIVDCNQATAVLHGYRSKDEIVGKNALELIAKKDHQRALEKMAKQPVIDLELTFVAEDGREFQAEMSTNTIMDNLGKPEYFLAVTKDITKRLRGEQEIRVKNYALASSINAVVFADLEGKLSYVNASFLKTWGYDSEGEVLGRFASEFWVFEEKAMEVVNAVSCGEGWAGELVAKKKDGSVFDVELSASLVKDVSGKPLCMMASFVDVTERKKVEANLRLQKLRLQNIVDCSSIGTWEWNVQTGEAIVNERWAQMVGYTLKELEPVNIETLNKLTHPDDLVKLNASAQLHFERKTDYYRLDFRMKHKDGSWVWVYDQGKVTEWTADGKPLKMFGTHTDITERKKAEEHKKGLERKLSDYSKNLKILVDLRTSKLKDANERLVESERLAAIGEIAGMVGHDLRNPITGIKNATYFLKKKGTTISKAQNKKIVEFIDKALEHLDKIINDLLDYSREMHLELTKHATHTLVGEALRMIQVPNRIQIINSVQEDTLIWVNADKLMRVFINLIKNAVDAMPEKGTLEISSCKTKDCIEISFADTGTGMSEETLKKLFTPLFTTKAQGMGFGLAICKRIIEAHGGTISMKTELNKGTTFTITLPIKPNSNVECEKTFITH